MNRILQHPRRQFVAVALSVAALAATGVAPAFSAGAVEASTTTTSSAVRCPAVTWGSTPETSPNSTPDAIVGARAGRHACFDRFVVDIAGAPAGFDVRYVDAVYFGGAGHRVDLRGGAVLQVIVRAPAPGALGQNDTEFVDVTGFRTIRQVAMVDAYDLPEALMGLGIRARLPFRVFVLEASSSSSRLVVDVAHHW
jgi:hypothetical protein